MHHDTSSRTVNQPSAPASTMTLRAPWLRLSALVPLCASLVLTACASLGGGAPEDQVRQRASERWQAILASDYNKAWAYSTPGYRAVVTPEVFRGRHGSAVQRFGTEVVSVKCPEATRCLAMIRIDFRPLLGGRFGDKMDTHIDETWLLEDGQWWVFQSIKGN